MELGEWGVKLDIKSEFEVWNGAEAGRGRRIKSKEVDETGNLRKIEGLVRCFELV
jgi:hypothetical protein